MVLVCTCLRRYMSDMDITSFRANMFDGAPNVSLMYASGLYMSCI